MKRINRGALLRLLRRHNGLSRAQLASESGLTKSTVGVLVKELIEEGWLAEVSSHSVSSIGRPSTPLEINSNSRAMIGVEITEYSITVVCVSLVGQILSALHVPLIGTAVAAVCSQMTHLIQQTKTQLKRRGVHPGGVGVGLPGDAIGIQRFSQNLNWRTRDFAPLARHALMQAGLSNMPLHVQNAADTAALGEYVFAEDNTRDSLVFVHCGDTVRAGVVLNDRPFIGAPGAIGEIGHTILRMDGPACSCGRKGCVEALLGATALSQLSDPGAQGHFLGVLLHNMWTTFNPSLLIVGGPSGERYPGFVDAAKATLQSYAISAGMVPPLVRAPRYGALACAAGAAALVLHSDLHPIYAYAKNHPTYFNHSLMTAQPCF